MIYLITNRKLIRNNSFLSVITQAINGGIDGIILREKDLSDEALLALAKSVKRYTDERGIPLIINGRPAVANQIDAYAHHFTYKRFMKEGKHYKRKIGVSIHTVEEAVHAEQKGADYLLASHIFETKCKEGLRGKGPNFLREIINKVNIPVIALGGINLENMEQVYATGIKDIAVMSYIMAEKNPKTATQLLKEQERKIKIKL